MEASVIWLDEQHRIVQNDQGLHFEALGVDALGVDKWDERQRYVNVRNTAETEACLPLGILLAMVRLLEKMRDEARDEFNRARGAKTARLAPSAKVSRVKKRK